MLWLGRLSGWSVFLGISFPCGDGVFAVLLETSVSLLSSPASYVFCSQMTLLPALSRGVGTECLQVGCSGRGGLGSLLLGILPFVTSILQCMYHFAP